MSDQSNLPDSREVEQAAALRALGVTPAEASLFHVVHYGITIPPSSLISWTAGHDYYSLGGQWTEEECRIALDDCLAKGWLQIIDETILAEINDDLRKQGFIGPIYGWPQPGMVDFTLVGAQLWERISESLFRKSGSNKVPFVYTDVVYTKTACYYTTREAALNVIESVRNEIEAGVTITFEGPFPIGPWRAQWWRRFDEGYRIDVIRRMQWQGSSVPLEEICSAERTFERADLGRLKEVRDRHKLTIAEWTLLYEMERGPISPTDSSPYAQDLARRKFNMSLSDNERLSVLNSCQQRGLLRLLNSEAIDEIRKCLRSDSAFLALPQTAELRYRPSNQHFDFSPAGADLYRTVSADWLGKDWESRLIVEKHDTCEEHLYSESDEGFQSDILEHESKGTIVQSQKVIPIGSWCVYWWERFPRGYQMCLELRNV